jgi:arylsulfatase A-like enzyme
MFMSSPKPHSPYDPPRPYDALYEPRSMPAPFGSETDLEQRNPGMLSVRVTHALDTLSPAAIQVIRSYYYGNITFLDKQIGRVVNRLEETGLIDDTIILFTADHGDLMGDFGTFFKGNHLNGSVRIPFMMCGPGIAGGQTSEALVGLQDILPTLAALVGAPLDQDVQGLDLCPHLADAETPVRDVYYAQTMDPPGQSCMVADAAWKYVYSQRNGVEELYDQVNDPGELMNVAPDPGHAERLNHYRRLLRRQAEALGDTAVLDGDGFARSECDLDAIRKQPVSGMGWRFF